jgi:hypothetical protein
MIIGLSGYARSGKDTVAGMLIGLHRYENVAFANTIRSLLFAMDPLIMHGDIPFRLQDIVESKGWETAKTEYPEVRRLLQDLGVGGRDLLDDNVWINAALKDLNKEDRIVVTDVRFKNEAARIKNMGGQIWRVNRINIGPANDHISETDLDDWGFDAVITNNSDMPNLIKQIRALLG